MKKVLLLGLSVAVVAISTPFASAADAAEKPAKKPRLTEEQRKLRKEMVDKYDTNKNGKLDKEERSKMSKEDREKMDQAGLGGKRKNATGGDTKTPSQ